MNLCNVFQNNGKTHYIHIFKSFYIYLFILVWIGKGPRNKTRKPIMLPPGSETAPEQVLRST